MRREISTYLRFAFPVVLILLMGSCSSRKAAPVVGDLDTVQVTDSLPLVVFTSPVQDVGKLLEGEVIKVRFEYYNKGASDLRITGIETSCGCTEVEWSKSVLPSGKGSSLQVIFDSHSYSGLQTKAIRVLTNARNPETLLAITADIVQNKTNKTIN